MHKKQARVMRVKGGNHFVSNYVAPVKQVLAIVNCLLFACQMLRTA